ncbi:MAG: MBL fold metallo-hydrolase [Candidatus Dormibacteraeota bacterium]|nr:MBL fold metallo-hydrolase [Candidatus Dormibacteraeota bacterium]
MRAGAWEVRGLVDGWGREPGREVLVRPGFEGDPWTAHSALLDDGGWLSLTLGGFLVRGEGRILLVDLGAGRIDNGRYQGGGLPARLREQGVTPEQVTDVLFTHLHFDHVGWVTQRGEIQFPRARHRVHRADWEYFVNDPEAAPGGVRKLRPVESLVDFAEDGEEVAPGVRLHLTPGHTPGHCVVRVGDEGSSVWLLGDLAHCPFELEEPGWRFTFDHDGEQAERSRVRFAQRVTGSGDLLYGAHFPDLRPGRLERGGDGVRWVPEGER